MKKYFLTILFILPSILAVPTYAQFEGYGSIAMGYNKNPLNNYENAGDQVKQTYLELKYSKEFPNSLLNFSYVNGLMLFNQFNDRNFYEHSLNANYQINFEKQPNDSVAVGDSTENNIDSLSNKMLFGITLNSRMDKEAYHDFDNYGISLNFLYKFVTTPEFNLSISNSLSFRNYAYVEDLSNVTDLLSFEAGTTGNSGMKYGAILSGGFKYYTQTFYDTSKYEQIRSFNSKSKGKGKPGSDLAPIKKILITPQSNGTYQVAFGIYSSKEWTDNYIRANVLYRYNIRSQNRYLTQYVNTSFLSEDIYNDYFSYEGPEASIMFSQKLAAGIKLTLEGQIRYKKYKAPALDLTGVQIDGNRNDLHSYLELNLSRYFDLGNFGFDITLTGGLTRNQSNDDFNDFSSYYASLGLGIGF